MTITTLLKYLIGNRDAILRIARCPGAIWVGLLFVLTAGFAREYDGEDLLHEPWHLLIPLAASAGSSAVLYLLVRFVAWLRGAPEPPLIRGYLTFLKLYWMTAPLALVYAIPFERFLTAGDAMRANLLLLAIVATWRVLLITQGIAVLYNTGYWAAWFLVMLFADSVQLAIVSFTPLPILSFMGGVRLSESDLVLQETTLLVGMLGFCSWLVWFFGSIIVAAQRHSPWRFEQQGLATMTKVSRPLWILAVASLGVWALILPLTQPEQILRYRVERDLRENRIRDAFLLMSAHEQNDFPPHWDPPPSITYRRAHPDIVLVQEMADGLDLKPWVRGVFSEKFVNSLRGHDSHAGIWFELEPAEIERRLRLLDRLPNRAEVVGEAHLQFLEGRTDLPEEIRVHVKELLAEAKVNNEPGQQNGEPKSSTP